MTRANLMGSCASKINNSTSYLFPFPYKNEGEI